MSAAPVIKAGICGSTESQVSSEDTKQMEPYLGMKPVNISGSAFTDRSVGDLIWTEFVCVPRS